MRFLLSTQKHNNNITRNLPETHVSYLSIKLL